MNKYSYKQGITWKKNMKKKEKKNKNKPQLIIITAVNYTFFYKQLGSGRSPQSCLYFQDFQGSKLLNSCLAI